MGAGRYLTDNAKGLITFVTMGVCCGFGFLVQQRLIDRLLHEGELELTGPPLPVIRRLATSLHGAKNRSLVSLVAESLVNDPDVVELYADNDTLKERIGDLGPR